MPEREKCRHLPFYSFRRSRILVDHQSGRAGIRLCGLKEPSQNCDPLRISSDDQLSLLVADRPVDCFSASIHWEKS